MTPRLSFYSSTGGALLDSYYRGLEESCWDFGPTVVLAHLERTYGPQSHARRLLLDRLFAAGWDLSSDGAWTNPDDAKAAA